MGEQVPALIVIAPLFGALFITGLWWFDRRLCFPIALAAGSISLVASVGLFFEVLSSGVIEYRLGGWIPPFGIAFHVDHLNGLILVVVSLVSLLNLAGSKSLAEREFEEKIGPFYALYLLFTTGLLGILITGDAFNLFVLLEIASLTGYALIGLGSGRASLSGLNYLLMGTVGASLYLLGVGSLYLVTGSLNMLDISMILPSILPSNVVLLAFILCLVGLFVKMALFPLHGWLANAYSFAPSSVSSLVAPLTTKVMMYAMFRIILTLFTIDYAFNALSLREPIMWLAILAIVVGSILALSQQRLKKMLACIVVAEVGYMVGGFWLGNRIGMSGAILHIVNDAVMTLCVFLAAAALIYRYKDDRLSSLNGAFQKMPLTMSAMVIGGLSLIGVPPTCGFFSKWFLITGGIAADQFIFVAALIFSSLVNIILFFRIFEACYFGSFMFAGEHTGTPHMASENHSSRITEAPADLLVPLMVTAILVITLGIFSGDVVTEVISYAIPSVIP